jgi:hypothetical protein
MRMAVHIDLRNKYSCFVCLNTEFHITLLVLFFPFYFPLTDYRVLLLLVSLFAVLEIELRALHILGHMLYLSHVPNPSVYTFIEIGIKLANLLPLPPE